MGTEGWRGRYACPGNAAIPSMVEVKDQSDNETPSQREGHFRWLGVEGSKDRGVTRGWARAVQQRLQARQDLILRTRCMSLKCRF